MAIDLSVIEINRIIELYTITHGTEIWRYAVSESDIAFLGNTYSASPIQREELEQNEELEISKLKITFPISASAQKFLATAPAMPMIISIVHYQPESGDYETFFQGEVTKVTFAQNGTAIADATQYFGLIHKKLPFIVYQSYCNNVLFDARCSLVASAFNVSIVTDAVNGQIVESAGFSAYPDYYFQWGVMVWGSDQRMITFHAGAETNIHAPFADLKAGDTVICRPGCDKAAATCVYKFSNLSHFLGFPYVPRKNPVTTSL